MLGAQNPCEIWRQSLQIFFFPPPSITLPPTNNSLTFSFTFLLLQSYSQATNYSWHCFTINKSVCATFYCQKTGRTCTAVAFRNFIVPTIKTPTTWNGAIKSSIFEQMACVCGSLKREYLQHKSQLQFQRDVEIKFSSAKETTNQKNRIHENISSWNINYNSHNLFAQIFLLFPFT